jgi:hypothetical protein
MSLLKIKFDPRAILPGLLIGFWIMWMVHGAAVNATGAW